MTSEDVILIIDEICDKCGIAISSISEIIPAFASYEIAGFLSSIIITIILGLVIGISFYLLYEKEKTEYEESHKVYQEDGSWLWKPHYTKFSIFYDGSGLLECLFILFIIYAVMGALFLIFYMPSLIQWAISPEAAFIVYVLNFI